MDKVQWDEIAEGVAHFGRNYRIYRRSTRSFDIWDREWDTRPLRHRIIRRARAVLQAVGCRRCHLQPLVKALKDILDELQRHFPVDEIGRFDLRRVLSVETAFPPQTTLRTRALEWSGPRLPVRRVDWHGRGRSPSGVAGLLCVINSAHRFTNARSGSPVLPFETRCVVLRNAYPSVGGLETRIPLWVVLRNAYPSVVLRNAYPSEPMGLDLFINLSVPS